MYYLLVWHFALFQSYQHMPIPFRLGRIAMVVWMESPPALGRDCCAISSGRIFNWILFVLILWRTVHWPLPGTRPASTARVCLFRKSITLIVILIRHCFSVRTHFGFACITAHWHTNTTACHWLATGIRFYRIYLLVVRITIVQW